MGSRPRSRLVFAAALPLVLLVAGSCSSTSANRVEIVDGTAPTTTVSLPTVAVPADLGEPTLTDESTITTVSVGDVEFGSTLEAAQIAAGTPFVPVEGTDACLRARPETGPEGLTFLVVDGTVERADIDGGPVTTRSGAGIGMTSTELQELYPTRLEESAASDGSPVFTFVPEDAAEADFRIVFQTDAEAVTSIRAGRLPAVTDGC